VKLIIDKEDFDRLTRSNMNKAMLDEAAEPFWRSKEENPPEPGWYFTLLEEEVPMINSWNRERCDLAN